MSDRIEDLDSKVPYSNDGGSSIPDPEDIDWGPPVEPLDDGDPCPACGHTFDPDQWDVRHISRGPTLGETWKYTCPECEQETCSIGT